jgi:hypothetical protein
VERPLSLVDGERSEGGRPLARLLAEHERLVQATQAVVAGRDPGETLDRIAPAGRGLLGELGRDQAQGYHLTHPRPADAVEEWLRAHAAC